MADKTESMNNINQQVFDLLELAKQEEWDEQTIADNLAGIECSIDDKLMAYRRYMDKLETAAKLADAEKKVYAEQAKPYGDRAKSFKRRTQSNDLPASEFIPNVKYRKNERCIRYFLHQKQSSQTSIRGSPPS